jgi:hypothetical protein
MLIRSVAGDGKIFTFRCMIREIVCILVGWVSSLTIPCPYLLTTKPDESDIMQMAFSGSALLYACSQLLPPSVVRLMPPAFSMEYPRPVSEKKWQSFT